MTPPIMYERGQLSNRVLFFILAGFGVALAAMLWLFTGMAHAETTTTLVNSSAGDATFSISPQILAVLVGLVTPLATGLLTKLNASTGIKALVSFVLIAILAVVNELTTKPAGFTFNVWDTVYLFVLTLVSHAASYLQIWAPLNGGTGTFTNNLTPNLGLGGGAPAVVNPPPAA